MSERDARTDQTRGWRRRRQQCVDTKGVTPAAVRITIGLTWWRQYRAIEKRILVAPSLLQQLIVRSDVRTPIFLP